MSNQQSERSVLMVGLPETGKSTYLGALFNTLKDDGAEGIRLQALPAERDYLMEIERAWLSLKPLARSSHQAPKDVEFSLLLSEPPRTLTLQIPDIVGETYKNAYEYGQWDESLEALIHDAGGLLLFIRADTIVVPELISIDTKRPPHGSGSPQPWRAELSPTQAVICDLLEQVSSLREGSVPPLAVLISAWDTVAEHGLTPSEWLTWQLPLFAQWLSTRTPHITAHVFGVSAQGGELLNEDIRKRLASDAAQRPVPANGDPLTAPLRWLLERE
jgi:Double-GTPase 1